MKRCCSVFLLLLVLLTQRAFADGGTVRISERTGAFRVTVFTSPTPLRAGPVDISVLVQDVKTGAAVADAEVEVRVGRTNGVSTSYAATRQSATNKLFQDVRFDLPSVGAWRAEVFVKAADSTATANFPFEATGPLPRWRELWAWIVLPIPVIALYGLHQALVARESRARRSGSESAFGL